MVRFFLPRITGLVYVVISGIVICMAPLSKTNSYIRNPDVRHRAIRENARESSHFEGARNLPPIHRSNFFSRRLIASAKNAVKGS